MGQGSASQIRVLPAVIVPEGSSFAAIDLRSFVSPWLTGQRALLMSMRLGGRADELKACASNERTSRCRESSTRIMALTKVRRSVMNKSSGGARG